ncbi:hypothetical protein BKA62DRAFT_704658 [Auriculariales sp. MPI-PUGE-AT-0066]|nr:hypothetical protein BKA62DRAFT_704658 [Auriculariales sp. MPI-PUGE-AT-0066]
MKYLATLSFVALAIAAPTLDDQTVEAVDVVDVAERGVNWDIIETIWKIANNEYKLDSRELLATYETCLVESGCQNLNYGDKDSLGVWQQRYSMGWCPNGPQQCRDVVYSTHRYLDVLVKCSAQHPNYSAGQIAQCTQVSEIPDAYDNKRAEAQSLLNEARSRFGSSSGGSSSGGSTNVGSNPSTGSSNTGSSSSGSSSSGSCAKTYTVVKGDTCSKVQSKNSVSFSTLRSLNSKVNSSCSNLQIGQKLCVKKGSSSSSSSGSTKGNTSTSSGCKSYHTVKKGENCNKIRGGTSLDKFRKLNPGVNSSCSNLQVGKKYCVA